MQQDAGVISELRFGNDSVPWEYLGKYYNEQKTSDLCFMFQAPLSSIVKKILRRNRTAQISKDCRKSSAYMATVFI